MWRAGGAGSASGAGAKRRAAKRDTWHDAKRGASPSLKRRTGPGGWQARRPHALTWWTGDAELLRLIDEVPGNPAAGERDDADGKQVQQLVVPPERGGVTVRPPVRAADHLVDAARIRPARRDLLEARAAAVQQHHVAVLLAGAVQRGPDRVRIGDVLPAGERDEGAVRQVRAGLAVLPCAAEVAGIDGGRSEPARLRGVAIRGAGARPARSRRGRRLKRNRASSRTRRGAGRGRGRGRSGARARRPSPRCRLGRVRGRASAGAIRSTVRSIRWAWACSMFTKPHSRLSRSSASWVPSGATLWISVCTVCSMPARASSSSQTKRVIDLVGAGGGAVQRGVVADGGGGRAVVPGLRNVDVVGIDAGHGVPGLREGVGSSRSRWCRCSDCRYRA